MRRLTLIAIVLGLCAPRPGLAEAAVFQGIVQDPARDPLAGARVELVPLLGNFAWQRGILAGSAGPEPVAATQTDDAGRFSLTAPTLGVWRLEVRAAGRVPMRYFPLPSARSIELPPLTLAPAGKTRIEVRHSSGEPAGGLWVYAESASADLWKALAKDGWRAGARHGRTDSRGVLELPRLPEERLHLHVFAPGNLAPLRLPDAGEQASAVLRPAEGGSRVLGVRDADGRPMAGVVVGAGEPSWPLGQTGTDGRLSLAGVPAGPVEIQLFAGDGRRHDAAWSAPAAGDPPAGWIALPRTAPLAGRVVADASGEPIAGALVWPGFDPGRFASSDADGRFQLEAPPAERFWLQAEAAGFLPLVEHPAAGHELVLRLEPAAAVAGRVVDEAGRPVPGARLTAALRSHPDKRPAFRPDRAAGRAVSDREGRFQLTGLHPAAGYELAVAKAGFHPSRAPLEPAAPGGGRPPLRVVLERSRAIHGRVVDAEDTPLAGVTVRLLEAAEGRRRSPRSLRAAPPDRWTTRTGAEGRFTLPDVPSRRVDVAAYKEGFSLLIVRGVRIPEAREAFDLGTLGLVRGAAVAGWVRAADGEPLVAAEVWVVDAAVGEPLAMAEAITRQPPDAATAAEGRFQVTDLPPGEPFHLLVDADGYLPAAVPGLTAPTPEPIEVRLESAAGVRGEVVDAEQRPIADAQVRLQPVVVAGEPRRGRRPLSVRSDGDGSFRFDEVAAGSADVDAFAPGFQPSDARRLEVTAGAPAQPLRFVLRRGIALPGRVTDRGGAPIEGARARAGRPRASSDAEGRFVVEGLAPGRQLLEVDHPGYNRWRGEVGVEPRMDAIEVVLRGGWPVAGQVVDLEGRPVAGVAVLLEPAAPRGHRRYRASSDVEGRFQLERVAEGPYDVEARKQGYGVTRLGRAVEVAGGPVEGVELLLRRGAVVRGQVRGLSFEELAAVRLTASKDSVQSSGTVDYEGRYEIPDLSPGDWLLRAALPGGGRQVEERLAVAPGVPELSRDLTFGGGLTLSGRVLHRGTPLAGAGVSLTGHDVAARRRAGSDHQGNFRLTDLEPGRYRLGVTHPRQGLTHNEELELSADREMTIDLRTFRVSGTVTDLRFQPMAGALVSCWQLGEDDSTGARYTAGTDGEGAFHLAQLPAGRYRLSAEEPGYAAAEEVLDVTADLDGLRLVLAATKGLELGVRLATGAAAGRVGLHVFGPAGRLRQAELRGTTPAGRAHFPSVPPGDWEVVVSAPGGAAVRLPATVPGPPLELVLPAAGPLAVEVPALAESPLVAHLGIVGGDGRPLEAVTTDGTLLRRWPLAAGKVTVDGVPAGVWTLRVGTSDGQVWQSTVTTAGSASAVRLE